jgi:hypothetical protein
MVIGGWRRWGAAIVVTLSVVFAGAAAPAGATSLDAAGTHIVAFADTHQTPFASLLPFELSTLQRLYCTGKGDRGGN